jgi:hypothetical protein
MMDPRHAQLLDDCEAYLERQQRLLDGLASLPAAAGALAGMDAALDQLSHAVELQWQEFAPELARGSRMCTREPEDPATLDG